MIRILISTAIHLAANAIGMIVDSLVLDGFEINVVGFLLAVVIFTAVEVVAGPLIVKIALKNAQGLMGGIALVTTFVGLLVTDIVSDGVEISGVSTWIASVVIVWLAAMAAGFLVPFLLVKKGIDVRREDKVAG